MKKTFAVLLCVICMLALVLVGCGGTQNNNNNGNTDPSNTDPAEKIVLTIGIPLKTQVLDYKDNAYTKWLEEQTGYDLQFKMYATSASDYTKQLATETSVDTKLPDILWGFALNEDLINQYGEDGYFIDISEYLNDREKSANWWEVFETYLSKDDQDYVWRLIHSDNRNADATDVEGPIYALPTAETSIIDTMDFFPLINTQWLRNVNMSAPTNLTELKQVLIAFRDQDANGNGNPNDEIPLLGAKNGRGCSILAWLINFFIYCDNSYYFNIDDNGKLYLPHTTDAYRNALRFINELIDEGLMNPSTLTYNFKQLRTVLANSDSVGVTVGHPSIIFTPDNDALMRFEALDLYGYGYDNRNTFRREVFITDSCDNPDAAWNLLMHMNSLEAAYRQRYGVLGEHWDWADEGATSVMGLPAIIKLHEDILGGTSTHSWLQVAGIIVPYTEHEADQLTDTTSPLLQHKYDIYEDARANLDKAKANVNSANVCPWLRFNEEEDVIAKTRADLKTALNTWMVWFASGDRDINSETTWNAYLAELDKAGLDEYLIAGQMCYERMYK